MRRKIKKMDCIEYLSVQAPLEKVNMLEDKQSKYIHEFVKRKEYSINKGEKEIFVGTWATPANKKRADTGIRTGRKPRKKEQSGVKVAVRLWEDNE